MALGIYLRRTKGSRLKPWSAVASSQLERLIVVERNWGDWFKPNIPSFPLSQYNVNIL